MIILTGLTDAAKGYRMPPIRVHWDSKSTAKMQAPGLTVSSELKLTPNNYRQEIEKYPKLKSNPAANWIIQLFGYEAITACTIQKNGNMLLAVAPGKKGLPSTRIQEGIKFLTMVLREASKLDVFIMCKRQPGDNSDLQGKQIKPLRERLEAGIWQIFE